MLEAGVTRIGVMVTFFGRQIQPVKATHRPMFEYSGLEDETRESAAELEEWELEERVRRHLQPEAVITVASHPLPYCAVNPPSGVSSLGLLEVRAMCYLAEFWPRHPFSHSDFAGILEVPA